MIERVTSNRLWARALRIVLVFALVFWSTFHVEALAFAALVNDSAADHEPGTLADIDVYELDRSDPSRLGGFVRDGHDTATNAIQSNVVKISSNGGATSFIALPAWGDSDVANTSGDVAIADFVEWSVNDSSVVGLQTDGGVATVTAKGPGSATVTCRLKQSAAQLASSASAGEVAFTVQVVAPYVSSLEIHRPDGSVCYDNEEIVVPDGELSAYALSARVNAFDEAAGSSASYDISPEVGLSVASSGVFGDVTWRVLGADGSDAPASEATVENGTVNLVGKGPVTVVCTSQDGLNGIPVSAQVVLKSSKANEEQKPSDEPADSQGPDYHQDTLTITVNAPESQPAADEGREGSSSSAAAPDSGESPEAQDPVDPDSPASPGAESPESTAPESDATAVVPSTHAYTLEELQAALEFGTETYTMPSGSGFTVVTGQGPSLAALLDYAGVPLDQQANIESIDFVCDGPSASTVSVSWADLVSANVFYPNAATGDESGAARSVIMLAARSYVHGADEPADVPASQDKLLDNTRFRLLYGAGGGGALTEPDSLRWITGIVVNMQGAGGNQPKPEVDPGDDPQVFVDYVPVPLGETAIMSPRYYLPPSISGGSVQFSYVWEMSSDGATWETVRDSSGVEGAAASGQALHVLTDESSVGTYRRFVLNITQIDGKTGEEVSSSIKSTPVKIRIAGDNDEGVVEEDAGYIVALDYIPPIAGDIANFTAKTTVTDQSITASTIEYEWQMSTDGGLTWIGPSDPTCPDLLKSQSGVMCTTLRIPTQPISTDTPSGNKDDNGEGGSDADNDGGDTGDGNDAASQLVYIRVVAHCAGHRSVASNAQPLTVHVGDPGGEKASDVEDAINGGEPQQPGDSGQSGDTTKPDESKQSEDPAQQQDEPSQPSAEPSQQPDQPAQPQQPDQPAQQPEEPETTGQPADEPSFTPPNSSRFQVTQVDSVVFENAPMAQTAGTDPTELRIFVNDSVTEAVIQQKTAEQQAAAATPGYRWTQLSTVNPTGDDVHAILGVNPFAPFAAPFALGLTAAGVVEKVVGFRRQTR